MGTPRAFEMKAKNRFCRMIAMETGMAKKRLVSLPYIQLAKVRTATRMTIFTDVERLPIELADAMAATPAKGVVIFTTACANNSPGNNCCN
jgi:hypothetical protein